jgi:N-glycosylase/DNA lyase
MFSPFPDSLFQLYTAIKPQIQERLESFRNVPTDEYFYELCFCICTPMTKAKNAIQVQKKLMEQNFKECDINLFKIIRGTNHYIRFHNKKILYLQKMKQEFSTYEKEILSNNDTFSLRNYLANTIEGLNFKEASHFLRNIGKTGVAIIDRHTFRNLQQLSVINQMEKYPTSKSAYLQIETLWKQYADFVGISIEEMDLLFFYNQTKTILK